MSLTVQALQIATVAALEEAQVSAKVLDSMVEPKDLADTNTVIAVVSVIQGSLKIEDKALLSAGHEVDLCIDFAIARKITRTITDGEGEDQTVTDVVFPDNGAGHDFVLHTTAYECFRALQATNGTWADLWRRLWLRGSQQSPSTWERGVASDKGVRLGILRYILKIELIDDPTPGEAPEVGTTWASFLDAMAAVPDMEDMAILWRDIISKPALPDWRRVQAQFGLTIAGVRSMGIAPIFETTGEAAPAATQGMANGSDTGAEITVDVDQATITETGGEPVVISEDNDV